VKIACWSQAPWPVINLAEISTGPIAPFSNRSAAVGVRNGRLCNLRVKSSDQGLGVSLYAEVKPQGGIILRQNAISRLHFAWVSSKKKAEIKPGCGFDG